jgi:hypothetical protein
MFAIVSRLWKQELTSILAINRKNHCLIDLISLSINKLFEFFYQEEKGEA